MRGSARLRYLAVRKRALRRFIPRLAETHDSGQGCSVAAAVVVVMPVVIMSAMSADRVAAALGKELSVALK